MMKMAISIGLVFIFSLLCYATNILAGDSVSIEASCTVPAIPGLNAPLLESTVSRQHAVLENRNQIGVTSQTHQQPVLPIVEEEDQEKEINSQGEEQIVLVRTFYPR